MQTKRKQNEKRMQYINWQQCRQIGGRGTREVSRLDNERQKICAAASDVDEQGIIVSVKQMRNSKGKHKTTTTITMLGEFEC